jgi:hypothetical protein
MTNAALALAAFPEVADVPDLTSAGTRVLALQAGMQFRTFLLYVPGNREPSEGHERSDDRARRMGVVHGARASSVAAPGARAARTA